MVGFEAEREAIFREVKALEDSQLARKVVQEISLHVAPLYKCVCGKSKKAKNCKFR